MKFLKNRLVRKTLGWLCLVPVFSITGILLYLSNFYIPILIVLGFFGLTYFGIYLIMDEEV